MVKLVWYCRNVLYVALENQDLLETSGVLSNLGLKTPLSKIPLLCDILF